jgi:hypothetical protein
MITTKGNGGDLWISAFTWRHSAAVGTPQIPRSLRSLPPLSKGAGAPAAGGFAADVSAYACRPNLQAWVPLLTD